MILHEAVQLILYKKLSFTHEYFLEHFCTSYKRLMSMHAIGYTVAENMRTFKHLDIHRDPVMRAGFCLYICHNGRTIPAIITIYRRRILWRPKDQFVC